MNYVVGFLFEADLQRVLLRLKARPAWQRGKLNGIGGKVEEGETPLYAMRREGREEASCSDQHLLSPGWGLFRTERFRGDSPDGLSGAVLHCFTARSLHALEHFCPNEYTVVKDGKELEPNTPVYYSTVPTLSREGRVLYNLEYLVPCAKVWLESGEHRRPLP